MIVEREDKGLIRFYKSKGIGGIFYRSFPTTEMFSIEDLSLSSRLTTKENETLLEKLLSKSLSFTKKYFNLIDGNLNNLENVNYLFKKVDKFLDENTRKTLYNIQSVLGHRNIGEQSNFMISLVVPEITALTIQDEIFISSQERSTRYVEFKENYIPNPSSPYLVNGYSILSDLYNISFNSLSEKYSKDFYDRNKRIPTENEINTLIHPTVRDSVRSFLPMGAKTSLVMMISARTAENIARKLLSSDNIYNKDAGELFYSIVADNVPSLSTHMKPDEFNKIVYKERIKIDDNDIKKEPYICNLDAVNVKIKKGSQSENQLINSICNQLSKDCKNKKETLENYLKSVSYCRSGKFNDLNDTSIRSSFVQFEITCSLGTARDLWRHRLSNRNIEIHLNNYIIPKNIYSDSNLMHMTYSSLKSLISNYNELIHSGFYSDAQLLIPMATMSTLKMSMSLAEAIFIAENRSTDEAHPEYKKIAFDMYKVLKSKYPRIMDNLKVFMGNSGINKNSTEYSRINKPNISSVNESLY